MRHLWPKAAFPLTRLNGRAGERATEPLHTRAGDVVTLFWTVLGSCRPRGEAGKGGRWAKDAINDILIVTCCIK